MMQSIEDTSHSCPGYCTSTCGAGASSVQHLPGAAAEVARTHVKQCAAAGLNRFLRARDEAKRICGCTSGYLKSSWGRQNKQVAAEAEASRFVASLARTCLAQAHVSASKPEAVGSSHSPGSSPLKSSLPSQIESSGVAWVDCSEPQDALVAKEEVFNEPAIAAPSVEVRESSDMPQPPTVPRSGEEASCGVAAPPHGDGDAVEDPGQPSETGTTPKQLAEVPEDKQKWMESYQQLNEQCANRRQIGINNYFRSFLRCCQILDSRAGSLVTAVQRDALDFAFIAFQQDYEKALQRLSSEIRRVRSSVNLMRVQASTTSGVNSVGVLCNVGLISNLKDAWSATIAQLEGVQEQITKSVESSKLWSLPKSLKRKQAANSQSACCSTRSGENAVLS